MCSVCVSNTCGGQKRVSDHLELELRVAVSVRGIELVHAGRAVSTLSRSASLQQRFQSFYSRMNCCGNCLDTSPFSWKCEITC